MSIARAEIPSPAGCGIVVFSRQILQGPNLSSLDSERFRSVPRTSRPFSGSLAMRATDPAGPAGLCSAGGLGVARRRGDRMRRREFILALGGAALWPLVGRAQQPTMLRVGFVGVQPREAALYNNFRRR